MTEVEMGCNIDAPIMDIIIGDCVDLDVSGLV